MAEETVVETLSAETEVSGAVTEGEETLSNGEGGETQPANDSDKIAEVMEKIGKNPKYKMSPEELDLMADNLSGKIPLPDIQESKTKILDEDGNEKEGSEEPKSELKKAEFNLEKLMKKVGAKEAAELESKFEGMKKRLSQRVDADPAYKETVEKLRGYERQVEEKTKLADRHVGFIADLQNGLPLAIKHLEKLTGLKVSKAQEARSSSSEDGDSDKYLDSELAHDFTSYRNETQSTIQKLLEKVERMEKADENREGEFKKHQEVASRDQAKRDIQDEMVGVAENMELFSGVKNKRAIIERWQEKKTNEEDTGRISEAYNELFSIANEFGVDLKTANDIWRGRNSTHLVEKARIDGKKSAYSQKTNQTLSSLQSNNGVNNNEFSRQRIEEIIKTKQVATKFPDKWFHPETGELLKSQVPQHSWDLFWPTGK